MGVVVFCTGKSAGVSTLALAVAARWPQPGAALLVEADPAGGDLAARFGLRPAPGLTSAAAAGRGQRDRGDPRGAGVGHRARGPHGGAGAVRAGPARPGLRAAVAGPLGAGPGAGVGPGTAPGEPRPAGADPARVDPACGDREA